MWLNFDEILTIFAGLGGLGALISVLVNIGKTIGLVKDGMGEKVFQVLNLIGFIAVALVYIFVGDFEWAGLDSLFQGLSVVLGFVFQFIAGKVTYTAVRGTPVVGFSHELRRKG